MRRLLAIVVAIVTGLALVPTPGIGATVTLVGAGDIAVCGNNGDSQTGDLIDGIPGTVFTAGDNAYPDGTTADFNNCYAPAWGAFKARTRPAPGNHDYHTSGAAPYFAYFGSNAGPSGRGYYAYDLGAWRVYSLNSEVISNAQLDWLQSDLAANPRLCSVAYWHHPLFSSGQHGNDPAVKPLWDRLFAAGAELVINGHDHNYERFAPQNPNGGADSAKGIREVVVGTGGAGTRGFATIRANSQVRDTGTWGVLQLSLSDTGYSGVFRAVPGDSFSDSFSGSCHGAGGPGPSPSPTPSDFTLSADPANNKVALSWTAVSGATLYRVKRAVGSRSFSMLAKLSGSATTYTDSTARNGTTYRYRVTAVRNDGSSVNSNIVTVTPP